MHDHRVPARPGQQLPQRIGADDLGDVLVAGGGEAVQGRDAAVPQHGGQILDHRSRGRGLALSLGTRRARGPDPGGGPLEDQRAVGQRQLDVLAERHLDRRVMKPPRERVAPRLHFEVPQALGGNGHVGAVPVDARAQRPHPDERAAAAFGPDQHDARPEHPVPLTEDGGTDVEGLASDGLRGIFPSGHDWLNVNYGNPADHLGQATRQGCGHAIAVRTRRVDLPSTPDTH